MSGFYVGQRVVCVDDTPVAGCLPPLVKRGKVYTVRYLTDCPECGDASVDVGFASRSGTAKCSCGARVNTYGHQLHGADRFAPYDNLHEQVSRIESEGVPAEIMEP